MKSNFVGFASPCRPGDHAGVEQRGESTGVRRGAGRGSGHRSAPAAVRWRDRPATRNRFCRACSAGRLVALTRGPGVRLDPFVRSSCGCVRAVPGRIRPLAGSSLGDVSRGLRGMRRIGVAGEESDSRPFRRRAAEAVDPSEREVVRAVERDEGQPFAGRSAAERKGAAPARAGNDSSGAGERGPGHRAGSGTATGLRWKPRPFADGADRSDGTSGEKALEIGRECAERVVVAQRDFNRRARRPSCVAQGSEPVRVSGLPARRRRSFRRSSRARAGPAWRMIFATGGGWSPVALRPHSTASNTWTTALVHTPPWVSTIPRRSERVGCAPSK